MLCPFRSICTWLEEGGRCTPGGVSVVRWTQRRHARKPAQNRLTRRKNGTSITSTMKWTIDHAAREGLQDQIASCVRRGVASGELPVSEQLPPAAELATALSVDRNTVLAAYRQLRDEGTLEFRRGRGARVISAIPASSFITQAARDLIATASAHGIGKNELVRIIKELT
jgi:GntR family transcriptional regulator